VAEQPVPPTPKQLRYLRELAQRPGTTFTSPRTRREASQELERMRGRTASPGFERRPDRRGVQDALTTRTPARSVHADEVSGYGVSARWARDEDPR
jgi:hypothetical protein